MLGEEREGPSEAIRPRAAYLKAARALLVEATESRRGWVRRVGILLQDARAKPPEMVAPNVAREGTEQREAFGEIRGRLLALVPPPSCARWQALAIEWLDVLDGACAEMTDTEPGTLIDKLRATQRKIAESRPLLERLQAEYARLVRELRQQIEAAQRGPRLRWPFRRGPTPQPPLP